MHPVWTGMISFGLVNIPVSLYTAVKPDTFEMNYLRKDDMCPIAYKKVCRNTGEEVPFSDIIKGYQYRKGDYVVLEEKDFEKADLKRTYTIEIEIFVDENDVDIKYAEKPYLLGPGKKGEKGYVLFREALAKSKKAGIGKFVLRNREHLVMLKPDGNALTLVQLRFDRVFIKPDGLGLPGRSKVPEKQMELALELINRFKGRFVPGDFKDTYALRLKDIIEAKKHGKIVHVREKVPRQSETMDILAKLKASLAAAKR